MRDVQRQFGSEDACQDDLTACRWAGRLRLSSLRAYAGVSHERASGLAMCGVPVPGVADGRNYLRSHVTALTEGTLLDIYHRRGRWRASFTGLSAAISQSGGCSGVAAILHVSEGNTYVWERAEWSGNSSLPAIELDKLLRMTAGDVANVAEIDNGLRRLREAYGKVGHILQTVTYIPRLDDATRRPVFQFSVSEGDQFRMGVVEFTGVPDGDAKRLQGRWRLKSGEVYDES